MWIRNPDYRDLGIYQLCTVPVAVCVPYLHSAIRILLFPRPFLGVVRDLRLILLHTDMIEGTVSHDQDTSIPGMQW
jgi:hypothetical protein